MYCSCFVGKSRGGYAYWRHLMSILFCVVARDGNVCIRSDEGLHRFPIWVCLDVSCSSRWRLMCGRVQIR